MNRRQWLMYTTTLTLLYWVESYVPESAFNNYFKKSLFMANSVVIYLYRPSDFEQERRFWYHVIQAYLFYICNVLIYSFFFTDLSNSLLNLDPIFFSELAGKVWEQPFIIFFNHMFAYTLFIMKGIKSNKSVSYDPPPHKLMTEDQTNE